MSESVVFIKDREVKRAAKATRIASAGGRMGLLIIRSYAPWMRMAETKRERAFTGRCLEIITAAPALMPQAPWRGTAVKALSRVIVMSAVP